MNYYNGNFMGIFLDNKFSFALEFPHFGFFTEIILF